MIKFLWRKIKKQIGKYCYQKIMIDYLDFYVAGKRKNETVKPTIYITHFLVSCMRDVKYFTENSGEILQIKFKIKETKNPLYYRMLVKKEKKTVCAAFNCEQCNHPFTFEKPENPFGRNVIKCPKCGWLYTPESII